MTRLSPDVSSPKDGIHKYLQEIYHEDNISYIVVHPDFESLLLLRAKNILAAFAFSSTDVNESYYALYNGFKSHYAQQNGQWDALDVSFVFCVDPNSPGLELFGSRVETDVYFCRKYVVAVDFDVATSLARLPFLPLARLDGQSLRPPSAQTFLQQCNVPAELAKFIVVQGERSPEKIIEDCISGRFGNPSALSHRPRFPAEQHDRTMPPVLLSSITIENFRAYRRKQTFNLGSSITVLYGPNGFGKTSFFDAIDFAVTGGIGRIKTSNELAFTKAAQHLDSGEGESIVSVSFVSDGSVRTVKRNVKESKQALLDGQRSDRKSVLAQLTGGVADRVENLVNLFRATHLFSQEQQELTSNFKPDCQLSVEIVSQMLAFEDYVSALKKAGRLEEILKAEIANAKDSIHRLLAEIQNDKSELTKLDSAASVHANSSTLDTEIATLKDMVERVGIVVNSNKPDISNIRGWRAALEARHADSESLGKRLSYLSKEAVELSRLHPELTALQDQIAQREQTLHTVEEIRTDSEFKLHQAEQRLVETSAKLDEKAVRATLYEWVQHSKPVYSKHLEDERNLVERIQQSTALLSQLQEASDRCSNEWVAAETNVANNIDRINTRIFQLNSIQSLDAVISAWGVNADRLNVIGETETDLVSTLEKLRVDERDIRGKIATATGEIEFSERVIAESERSQSELNNLLSQLQHHVNSGTCPLCGEDHGSTEELVRRIQLHVKGDSASGVRMQLSNLRHFLSELNELLANSVQKQQAANANLVELKNERTRIEDEINRVVNAANGHGVNLASSMPTPSEQLRDLLQITEQDIAALRQFGASIASVLAEKTNALEISKTHVSAKSMEVASLKSALEHVHLAIAQLRNDERFTQLSLDVEIGYLEKLQFENYEQLGVCRGQVGEVQAEVSKLKMDIGTIRQEVSSIKSQIATLRTRSTICHQAISKTIAALAELKLPQDTSEEELLEKVAQEAQVQAQLFALRDKVASIELAMDVATTAAALTQLHNNLRVKEQAVITHEERRRIFEPWLAYFVGLAHLISSQQQLATSNFTSEYGPRTSVIQRRLRSVYGFDDVEIDSRDGAIRVRVKRNDEILRPTDYFSQSQQQTLMLGLFLTACSSQTWSSFSPVFLDDPVTHFDDLNTYALLDLLVGLLESGNGPQQFIISTCDERLLQLARQKFRHFGDAAKFYRFTAIGEQGPEVQEISQQ